MTDFNLLLLVLLILSFQVLFALLAFAAVVALVSWLLWSLGVFDANDEFPGEIHHTHSIDPDSKQPEDPLDDSIDSV